MKPPEPLQPLGFNPYTVLGLTPAATEAEIKQAYFTLVRAHPPETDPMGFKRIRAAYDRLRTPEKRRDTDLLLPQPWQPYAPSEVPLVDTSWERDLITAMEAFTELYRRDYREDYREVEA